MTISFDHHRPIYLQLKEYLYSGICRGERPPGEKLPSVREFAVEAGVNPNTVSRTYSEMERDGVAVSKRGQGTFVTTEEHIIDKLRVELAESQVDAFLQSMERMGLPPHKIVELIKDRAENSSKEDPS
ncbi:GntR family transcriptional regulator [Alkalicoccus halolimnae]|uniref:GntR family transcriptional regulator n=1 Tax=Alkalicoccus halolimnae TaxID=1667239 RepID=A0A5C7FEA9_9BACI|nr:GntR family transcriptional regulator [Alkalicoccus halolimnae]TXF81974.1 GntR family transcriptional regulator [Alkalicoccus halolimnae]